MKWKKILFEKNEAVWDRALRLVAGFLLVLAFAQWWIGSPWNYLVLLLGMVGILTGISGHCSAYPLLGFKTR